MARKPIRICKHCHHDSKQLALKQFEVGPSKDGHCGLCGSLYCLKCLRPLLPDDPTRFGTGLKIVGDTIYCVYADCGVGYAFMINGAGHVVLEGPAKPRRSC